MTARLSPVARHDTPTLRAIAAGLAGLSFAGFSSAAGVDWLCMENVFRSTPPAAPNSPSFFSFLQTTWPLPHVTASPARGWVAKCDNHLTDTGTSRTWAVSQATSIPSQYARCTAITFSAVTETFWVQRPDPMPSNPFATTWFDTGTNLIGAGTNINTTFSLSIGRNLNGQFTFRVNSRFLRFTGGAQNGLVVRTASLSSATEGVHQNLDAILFLSSDELTAPPGSTLCVANIRAWVLPCLGDTNNDGVVSFSDLNNVLGFFGQTAAPNSDITGNIAPDADNDGVPDDDIVNFADLNAVLSGLGTPCSGAN